MPKKRKNGAAADMVPNPSFSRTARAGAKTEDELLPQRKKAARPVPRMAGFTRDDPWRVLRITGEFVHAFDVLAEVGAAISIFGSARAPDNDPMYHAARDLAARLATSGF